MKSVIVSMSTIRKEGGILAPSHYLGAMDDIKAEIERRKGYVKDAQRRLRAAELSLKAEEDRVRKLRKSL